MGSMFTWYFPIIFIHIIHHKYLVGTLPTFIRSKFGCVHIIFEFEIESTNLGLKCVQNWSRWNFEMGWQTFILFAVGTWVSWVSWVSYMRIHFRKRKLVVDVCDLVICKKYLNTNLWANFIWLKHYAQTVRRKTANVNINDRNWLTNRFT